MIYSALMACFKLSSIQPDFYQGNNMKDQQAVDTIKFWQVRRIKRTPL